MPDQAEQGHAQALVAVVKEALVEEREQRIQDGRVGLEDFINEGHLAGWQVTVYLPHIFVLLQPCSQHKLHLNATLY